MGILNVKSDYPSSSNASGAMRDERYMLGNMNAILEEIAKQNVENAKFLRGMSRKLEEGIDRMEEASMGGMESGSEGIDKALLTELRDEIKKELEQIKVQDVQMPQLDTGQLAADMAEQIGEQVGKKLSGQLSNQMAQQVSQQVAGQVTVHMAQQMSGRMAQQVSQQVTNHLSDQMSQQLANQVSAQMSQQLADQVTAQMSEQLSGRMLQQMSEQVSYEVASQIAQQTQQLSGQLVPQFTQHMEQVVANQLTQQVAQQSAQVMQQMMQQLSVELSRQISQQVSAQVAEQMRHVSRQYVPGQEETIVMYDDAKLNEIDSKLARVTTLPSMMKNLIESTNDATVKKVDQVVADQNAKSFFEIQAMRKMVRITLWVSLIAAGLAIINFL